MAEQGTIRAKAIRGVSWNLLNTVLGIVLQFVRAVFLARFLGTEDFGIAGKAYAAIFVASFLVDVGFGNAIIQAREIKQATIESAFTVQFFVGLGAFLSLFVGAGYLADLYGDPAILQLIVVLGFGVWLDCILILPVSIMYRRLEFKAVNVILLTQKIVSITTAIALALLGFGYWTLIVPDVFCRCLVIPCIFFYLKWIPTLRVKMEDLKPVVKVSFKNFVNRALATANTNLDYAILGGFFSDRTFGLYYFSYKRTREPMRKGVSSVRTALFPALCRTGSDESLRRAMVESIGMLSMIVYPLTACLFITLPQLIPLVFGEKWIPAIPMMQAFSIWGFFIPLGLVTNSGLLSRAIFGPELTSGALRIALIGTGLLFLCWSEQSVISCVYWVVFVEIVGNSLVFLWGAKLLELSILSCLRPALVPLGACVISFVLDHFSSFKGIAESPAILLGIVTLKVVQVFSVSSICIFVFERRSLYRILALVKDMLAITPDAADSVKSAKASH